MKRILQTWNMGAKRVKGITSHRSLDSKVFVKYNGGLGVTKPLKELLQTALEQYDQEDIISAINNYFHILTNSNYFFEMRYKGLGQFIHAGLNSKGGFVKFLDKNQPYKRFRKKSSSIYFNVKQSFSPLTTQPCLDGYDEERRLYYGFSIEEITATTQEFLDDVEYRIDTEIIGKKPGYFYELELGIAYLLFTKMTNPKPDLLRKFFSAWKVEKEKVDLSRWND
mgnify:CR=1 FL=1